MPVEVQTCQYFNHIDFGSILSQATKPRFLKHELLLAHSEWVLKLDVHMVLVGLDQINQLDIWCIRQCAPLPGVITSLKTAVVPSTFVFWTMALLPELLLTAICPFNSFAS